MSIMQLFLLFLKFLQPIMQSFQGLILTQSQRNYCLSYSLHARHSLLAIVLIQLLMIVVQLLMIESQTMMFEIKLMILIQLNQLKHLSQIQIHKQIQG